MLKVDFSSRLLHFRAPAGTSRGVYTDRRVWYVRVESLHRSRPIVGLGECAPLPGLSCDDVPHYEEVLRQACMQWQEEERLPRALLRDFPSILMGFETAERSLEACRKGDAFALWDSPFTRMERGIAINGLVWMGDYEAMLARMEEKLAQGYRCVKLKIGAIDFAQEVKLLRILRQRYPRERVELRLDANGAFSPEEAMGVLNTLAPFDIHSIEQPIAAGQWDEMARLCRESPIPIALDEELIGINRSEQKAVLLDTISPQYIILKPSLHGGFSGAEEWQRLADARGIAHWATSALESNVGLNAIAQWCAATYDTAMAPPQGLGTGQLFVDNYEGIALRIEGDQLWRGTEQERNFRLQLAQFQDEWQTDCPTMWVQTSGSTGQPTRMEVEKRRMVASARATIAHFDLKAGDVALLCLPLEFIAGKMQVVRSLVGDWHLQVVAPCAQPYAHLLAPPTFVALTPMQAFRTLNTPSQRELLRDTPQVLIGGGSISEKLHAMLQTCRGEVWSSYGMTETLSHIALRRLNGEQQREAYQPLPGVRVELDERGCLVVHAPAVHPAPLVTNDLALLEANGGFRILGRVDNVVCSGGLKLQIEELEQRLSQLPFSVQLTAVPDAVLGEALTLLHTPTSQDVAACLRPHLQGAEWPRHIFEVEELPTTATGKPARAQARELAKACWAYAKEN